MEITGTKSVNQSMMKLMCCYMQLHMTYFRVCKDPWD